MLFVKNESERLKKELVGLRTKNKPLLKMVLDIRDYCKKNFNKDVTITMIGRTDAEQDFLYKDNSRYQKKKFKSPHQFWHALDLRSRTFTQEEIDQLVKYLNEKYNDSNYYKWTAKCHTVGHGMHFHVQYVVK